MLRAFLLSLATAGAALGATSILPERAWGQEPAPEPAANDTTVVAATTAPPSYEFWVGLSGGSSDMGTPLGITPGQRLAITAFRLRRPLGSGGDIAAHYTVDLVPLAMMSRPLTFPNGPHPGCNRELCPESGPLLGDGAAYGFGIIPLGAEISFVPHRRAELTVGASAGGLLFDRKVPLTSGARFNFTASIGAAFAILSDAGRGVSIGYRLHHLSNAGMAVNNPGLASHLFFAGVRWPGA
jgi:hypothetical protein